MTANVEKGQFEKVLKEWNKTAKKSTKEETIKIEDVLEWDSVKVSKSRNTTMLVFFLSDVVIFPLL